MEVSLYLVDFQISKNPASVASLSGSPWPMRARRLRKILLLACATDDIMHMFLTKALLMPLMNTTLGTSKSMQSFGIDPSQPLRGYAFQHVACEDSIARCILNVDVDVFTRHGDCNIHIYQEGVTDIFFHGERVRLVASPPAPELAETEEETSNQDGDGPFPTAGGSSDILRFCFRCRAVSWKSSQTLRNWQDSSQRTECIECLHKIARFLSKCIFIQPMIFEAVHH